MALSEQQTVCLFVFLLLAFLFSLSAYGSHSCWRSHLDVKRVRLCSVLLFNGLLNSVSICQQPWSIQSMPSIWGGGREQAWQTEKMSQLSLWLSPPVEVVGQRRALPKLSAIMDSGTRPLHQTVGDLVQILQKKSQTIFASKKKNPIFGLDLKCYQTMLIYIILVHNDSFQNSYL